MPAKSTKTKSTRKKRVSKKPKATPKPSVKINPKTKNKKVIKTQRKIESVVKNAKRTTKKTKTKRVKKKQLTSQKKPITRFKLPLNKVNVVINKTALLLSTLPKPHIKKVTRKTKVKKDKKKQKLTIQKKLSIWLFVISFSMGLVSFLWFFWEIPFPSYIATRHVPISTKLYDRNGQLLYEIYSDTKRDPVTLSEIPQEVINATIAIEDQNFYKHFGISMEGILRALYKNLFKQKLEGGSTLTQQLVKNSLLTPERTFTRKARELLLTLITEFIYTKDEILELYLNQIPYGSTAYGIGAASDLYFGKNVKDLNLSEAALLAGLTAAPTKFSPFGAHPEFAKERQLIVLDRMVQEGYITSDQSQQAKEAKLEYAEPKPLKAPHFALWVKEVLTEKYGNALVEQGGLRVTTTLDLDLQEYAEEQVAEEVESLKKYSVGNGAVLVTKPKTGEILALVGSKNYFAQDEDGKVNIIFAQRQPGSSIKPLNYALGITSGNITASTPLADVPTCFKIIGQKDYCPLNYDNTFHGLVQARFALGNSYNIPAVRVLALNGMENFIDFATRLGISTWKNPDNYGLSLTLGGGEVTPYDMAVAYSTFANQGKKVPLNPILEIKDWQGNTIYDYDPKQDHGEQVLDKETAYIISHILQDNNARSQAFGSYSQLNVSGHPEVSVKTGTTNDLRDNWTIGFTGHILAVSWVGNNDNTRMRGAVSGVSGASPIWNSIIKYALDKAETGSYDPEEKNHFWQELPDSIAGREVCATTGILPNNPDDPGCPTRFEYFLTNHIGATVETGNKDLVLQKDTGQLANPDLPDDLRETQNRPYLMDPLGTTVCLDCPTASHSAEIQYPLIFLQP